MIKNTIFFFVIFIIIGVHSPASSKDWPSIKGWEVAEIDEKSCVISKTFEGKGSSSLSLIKYLDKKSLFVFDNENWSIEKGRSYAITFEINKLAFTPDKFAIGYVDGINRGIIIELNESIFDAFKKGSSINIVLWPGITANDKYPDNDHEDPVLIDSLSLLGSGAAVSQLDRCLAHVQNVADAASREKQKYDHLPDDPFAN